MKSANAPDSVQVNEAFTITVVTSMDVTDIKIFNENDMALGRKIVGVTDNGDGTKTWAVTVSMGTVGNDRTLKIVSKDASGVLTDSGVTVTIDILSMPVTLTGFDLPESAVANRTFIVTATTDLTATKIEIFNETGMKMGIKSLTSKVVDGQKEWTGVMSIGTQGDRTFSAYAVNKYGARSEALTDTISVKAFA